MQIPHLSLPLRISDLVYGGAVMFLFGSLGVAEGWPLITLMTLFWSSALAAFFMHRTAGAYMTYGAAIFTLGVWYCSIRPGSPLQGGYFPAKIGRDSPLVDIAAQFNAMMPYRSAAFLSALFRGSLSGSDPSLVQTLERSGISYVVGMYGYKVHLLARGVERAMSRIASRAFAMLAALASIFAFTELAGAPRSCLRAAIMVAFASAGELFGRKADSHRGLILAAVCIILADPSAWIAGGFLISFMSLVGIYILAPPLERMLVHRFTAKFGTHGVVIWFIRHAALAAAVNIAIIPLVAREYGSFPGISFISNPLAAAPLGMILILGLGALFLRSLSPILAGLLTPMLSGLVSFELFVARVCGMAPFVIKGDLFPPYAIAAYYLGLICVGFAIHSLSLRHS